MEEKSTIHTILHKEAPYDVVVLDGETIVGHFNIKKEIGEIVEKRVKQTWKDYDKENLFFVDVDEVGLNEKD